MTAVDKWTLVPLGALSVALISLYASNHRYDALRPETASGATKARVATTRALAFAWGVLAAVWSLRNASASVKGNLAQKWMAVTGALALGVVAASVDAYRAESAGAARAAEALRPLMGGLAIVATTATAALLAHYHLAVMPSAIALRS